jgi:tetratricopeptide (TPR) repeat protein
MEEAIAASPEVENQRNLRRLMLSIRSSFGKLNLLIAICDHPQYRDALIQSYEAELAAQGVDCARVRLDRAIPSLKDALLGLAASGAQPGVVTVLGADELLGIRLSEAKSAQEKFFFSVQWTREGLRAFQYPIVLWVTEQVAVGLGREAPDFWSWRGGVFEFVRPVVYRFPKVEEVKIFEDVNTYHAHMPVLNHALETNLKNQIQTLLVSEPDSPLLASLYFSLGNVYRNRLDQGKASDDRREIQLGIEAFQQAIQRQEKSENVDLAYSLNNLAGLYQLAGNYEAAVPLYEQVLGIYQRKLGDRDSARLISLDNLAGLYELMGRYDAALPLYEEALEIRQSKLGDTNIDTARSLNNLAGLYESMGRYDAALQFFEKALRICRNELGDRHPDTVRSLNNLAMIYYRTGRLSEAAEIMADVVRLLVELLGSDHPDAVIAQENLEIIHRLIQQGA